MKQETIEALAVELTKGTIAQKYIENPLCKDLTSAYIWVKTYLESERQIMEMANKLDTNN
ncbi:hypothetical protein [Acinetobacter sp. CWB-B33]|uniref:hypothetical protein n=1 Tax=Acinetobacter sp. CWB-B33 TaxID=2815724 RepID=UPI0031FE9CBE